MVNMPSKPLAAASGSVRIYRFRALIPRTRRRPIREPKSIAMKLIRAVAVLALLLLVAACDSLGTDPDRGTLVFRYSGDISGSFEASGEYPAGAEYAVGGANGSTLVMYVQDADPRQASFVLFGGPGVPGSYTLGPEADFRATLEITLGTGRAAYRLTAGTLVVQSVTDDRIGGRFSGTAVSPDDPARSITITDGYFDVPNLIDPGTVN
jgi:hypothetical protein